MLLNERLSQVVPTLTPRQIQFALRFASGPARRFAPNEILLDVGDRDTDVWLVVEGTIVARRRDGLGRERSFASGGPGQFSGEVNDLSGQASLAVVRAGEEGCVAYPFDQPHLRSLLIGSADIGEVMMRAFIDVDDEEGRELMKRLAVEPDDLPVLISPNGTILRRPSDEQTGVGLGITPDIKENAEYDVVVIGAGPAGLASAVYGASEGLSVLVLDSRSFGGQAGASARIENYLGFPTGITGQALTARAFIQAQKFGAQFALPVSVAKLDCSKPPLHRVELLNGVSVFGRTIVIASGARYRKADIKNFDRFERRSVAYWATPIEANLCSSEDVVLVGGGNSAGQAAVFLSAHARTIYLAVRGDSLDASMSRYLIDRIAATPNIQVHTETTVAELGGTRDGLLERVHLRTANPPKEWDVAARFLFLFIGAEPNTAWLDRGIALDDRSFIVTGQSSHRGLETSSPGVFAIGDVRSGSVKRVAACVGEGAAAVAQIHGYLGSL